MFACLFNLSERMISKYNLQETVQKYKFRNFYKNNYFDVIYALLI